MSSLGKEYDLEHRRGDDAYRKITNRVWEREQGQDRDGKWRRGDHSRGSSGSREGIPSSISLRRSQSPRSTKDGRDVSKVNHPLSPASAGSPTPLSAGRSPPILPSKPSPIPRETSSGHKISTAAPPPPPPPKLETRDPRLFRKINTTINTSTNTATNSPLSASVTDSPIDPRLAARDSSKVQSDASNSAIESSGSMSRQASSEPSHPLATLLQSFAENVSSSAALKYEHSKVKVKADHQAKTEKKMADLAKTFPAYAETSSNERKDTEKELAALDQRLAELQKIETDLLSAVPGIVQDSANFVFAQKEKEHADLVQRCIQVNEHFNFILGELKHSLSQHETSISKIEGNYESIESKLGSFAEQMIDLLGQLRFVQAQHSELDSKRARLEADSTAFGDETRKSLVAMQIDVKQSTERGKQHNATIEDTSQQVNHLAHRINLLDTQQQSSRDKMEDHHEKIEELEKFTGNQSAELQKLNKLTQQLEQLGATVTLMSQEIFALQVKSLSSKEQEALAAPSADGFSELKAELSALRAQHLELKREHDALKNVTYLHKESGTDMSQMTPAADHAPANVTRTPPPLADLDSRLQACLDEMHGIHTTLDQKQAEEDTRDDLISEQLEEARSSMRQAQEDLGRRMADLEAQARTQRTEEVERSRKLLEAITQLSKQRDQTARSTISPPNQPPAPQMPPTSQLQVSSGLPQPPLSAAPADLIQRLDKADATLGSMVKQLSSVSIAYQQLDHRYNNLSTEHVVRAMVQQMQSMYPYASNAQREIAGLKQAVDSFRNLPFALDNLLRVVQGHTTGFAKFSGLETRINSLEKTKTENDTKHENLVKHVKEEREKLVNLVNNEKNSAVDLADRLMSLEMYYKAEPEKITYMVGNVAKKLQGESSEALRSISSRVDALEADQKRQVLLDAFIGTPPTSRTAVDVSPVRSQEPQQNGNTDKTRAPLSVDTNVTSSTPDAQLSPTSASTSAPAESSKSFLPRSKAGLRRKKRKRYGSPRTSENYDSDRSDDETYKPTSRSSPPLRRKGRML